MISLTIGRNAFKICHKEGSRTTVWDVRAEDGEEQLIQTFKDVIAFVEGDKATASHEVLRSVAEDARLRRQADAATGGPPGGVTNGWAAYAPPPVPPHLEGEIELVQPGEEP